LLPVVGTSSGLCIRYSVFRASTRRALAIPVGMALAVTVCACRSAPPRRPNVILITIESLRADHVGAYGGRSRTRPEEPLTPTLDTLADEAVVYADAHAVTSWTLTSHASLFTGLYPTAHRTVETRDRLGDSYLTLAEVLAGLGYQTIGLASGPYLRRPFNLAQGFERWDDSMATTLPDAAHEDVTNPAMAAAWHRVLEQERDPSRPLFLFAYFWDPHYDYLPPPPYDRLYVTPACEPFDVRNYERRTDLGPGLAPARLAYLWSQYEGEIRATDAVLGELFASLRAHGLWDDSLVIVTADHGEEFLEHGYTGHKYNLYAETVHVPLLIKYPRAPGPGRDARLASLVDVFPTVLAVVGGESHGYVDGRSLLAEPDPDRAVLFELVQATRRRRADGTLVTGRGLWGGIRTRTRKLVWTNFTPSGAKSDADAELDYMGLFDVATDPGEQRNLAEQHLEEANALGRRFETESAGARAEAERHPPAGRAVLDEAAVERLRALGYLDDEAPDRAPNAP
jgi:arylsulfatase A-like enzyme